MSTARSILRFTLPSILAATLGVAVFLAPGAARADGPLVAEAPPPPSEVPAPPVQDPDRPYRHGFTLGLGIGIGLTDTTSTNEGASNQHVGLAPLSLSIGGYLNEKVALMGRAAGASYMVGSDEHPTQVLNAFYGPVIEYWPNDNVFLRGGVGLAVYGTNPLTGNGGLRFHEQGVGLDAGIGVSFFNVKHHSLGVVLEMFPSFYGSQSASLPYAFASGITVLSGALAFEWQYF